MIQVIGNIFLVATMWLAVLFVIIYHRTATWWRTEDGWHVMSFMSCIAAVLMLGSIRLIWSGSLWFDWLRTITFGSIPVVFAWRLWLLIKYQVRDRKIEERRLEDQADEDTQWD